MSEQYAHLLRLNQGQARDTARIQMKLAFNGPEHVLKKGGTWFIQELRKSLPELQMVDGLDLQRSKLFDLILKGKKTSALLKDWDTLKGQYSTDVLKAVEDVVRRAAG